MIKLTQLLNIFHTSGFISNKNKDGKKIDINHEHLFRIRPSDQLANTITSLRGEIREEALSTSIFLPFNFTVDPVDPALNTVDLSLTSYLPLELIFFVHCLDQEMLRYAGLNFKHGVLFLSADHNAATYTFHGRSFSCKPCGKASLVGTADLTETISSETTLDEISRIIGAPLGSNSRHLDLKVVVGADEFNINSDDDLRVLHHSLATKSFKQVHITFKRSSDSSLIKDFPALLVTKGALPADVIGIVRIPLASIDLTKKNHLEFAGINHFILHFPSVKAKLDLLIGIEKFDAGTKLFVDSDEIQAPVIINHPDMVNYKLVSTTINNYEMILRKPKQVRIEKGASKMVIPIDPITTFDPQTKKAVVSIMK